MKCVFLSFSIVLTRNWISLTVNWCVYRSLKFITDTSLIEKQNACGNIFRQDRFQKQFQFTIIAFGCITRISWIMYKMVICEMHKQHHAFRLNLEKDKFCTNRPSKSFIVERGFRKIILKSFFIYLHGMTVLLLNVSFIFKLHILYVFKMFFNIVSMNVSIFTWKNKP